MTASLAIVSCFVAMLAAGGLFLIVWGAWGQGPAEAMPAAPAEAVDPAAFVQRVPRSESGRNLALRLLLALLVASLCFILTGWPVAALFGFGAGFAWLSVRRDAREKARQLRQLHALATWAEALKDTMAASAGVTEALTISAKVAPPEIEADVRRLVDRMPTLGVAEALRRFADDIANPAADMIVAAFIMALTKQAGGLQGVLQSIAQNTRDLATLSQQVEAGRTEVRTQSKLAVAIIGSVVVGMILLRRDALAPFDTFVGQLALAVIFGLFGLAGFLFYRLGRSTPPRRVFARVADSRTREAMTP